MEGLEIIIHATVEVINALGAVASIVSAVVVVMRQDAARIDPCKRQ